MSAIVLDVLGIGVWSNQLAGFDALRAHLAGDEYAPPTARPPATVLAANERRRAPPSVLLAAEVAQQAVAMSGLAAEALPCVFASSHGEQSITDALCATLVHAPTEVSPTRFHNSVHNTAAGYWTIATGCHAASSALCAHRNTAGAGLLEAALQAQADQAPVLLVCYDVAGSGPLGEITGCTQPFGAALVLAPVCGMPARGRVSLSLARIGASAAWSDVLASLRPFGNDAGELLPLLAALAGRGGRCGLPASDSLFMDMTVEPIA